MQEQALENYAQKSSHNPMLLCFLLLAIMLWVGYYYAPLTGYNTWNLISNKPFRVRTVVTDFKFPYDIYCTVTVLDAVYKGASCRSTCKLQSL